MTREEETERQAFLEVGIIDFDTISPTLCFEMGAEWADSNPSEDTIKKCVELYRKWLLSDHINCNYVAYVKQNF